MGDSAWPRLPVIPNREDEDDVNPRARLLAFLSLAASSLLYVRIRCPVGPLKGTLWILRLLAEAMIPFVALIGALAAGLALLARSPLALLTVMLGAVAAATDVRQVTTRHASFAQAFGAGWEGAIPPGRRATMLQRP